VGAGVSRATSSAESSGELGLDRDTALLVLTGAGVSAESGLPTYRGSGGLWRSHAFERLASPAGFRADPALVWGFYSERREAALKAEPNPGHRALAGVERRLGERFLLVTQNVDGLHRRAGSERLIEIHGRLLGTRCSACERSETPDETAYPEGVVPRCEDCGGALRPAVVWFGEALDPAHLEAVEDFLERWRGGRLVFLAAGTSGAVWPAAGLVDVARARGAETWLVNAERADNAGRFDHVREGTSGTLLPVLLGA
jgi:NAD-dependent protein deacetylase/lipoamidase